MKLASAPYGLNERSEGWVKLKPDYIEGVNDTLDVVIVGGYLGQGTVRAAVCVLVSVEASMWLCGWLCVPLMSGCECANMALGLCGCEAVWLSVCERLCGCLCSCTELCTV